MSKQNTIKSKDITHREPGNGLPKWVRETAATRGYADAVTPLSLIVTENDINTAFDCAAHGDGAHCVMAQAGQRLGAKWVYFYRTTAWVDFGTGPIQRFITSKSIHKNVIEPFDKGERGAIVAGHYPLTPPSKSKSLKAGRAKSANTGIKLPSTKRNVVMHTDRVVMAAQN